MRARNIKPGFFKNEDLAECDLMARILFAGLWCMADREGRMEYRPKRIKAELLPYDNCNIEKLLKQLSEKKFIIIYEVDGNKYLSIPTFKQHQTCHIKEQASTIPAPDLHGASTGVAHLNPESLNLNPESLNLNPESLPCETQKKEKPRDEIILPEWLDKKTWAEFREHRKTIKPPMTPIAEQKAIEALSKFRDSGHDPTEIINQSIAMGWKGLFEPKHNGGNHGNSTKHTSAHEFSGKSYVGTPADNIAWLKE